MHTKMILLVEDNQDDEELALLAFQKSNIANEVVVARDGAEALDYLFGTGAHAGRDTRALPQVVLLDLRMPGMSGGECIEQIRTSWPEVKVVVLSALDDIKSVDAALNAGASAYVVKSVMPADIASVLRQAASGSIFRGVPGKRPVGATAPEASTEAVLTEREQTILGAIAAGKTTAAIAADLWVSEHTVKFHLTNIYRKLEVPNRAAAVRYAIERGLVER